MTLREWLNAWPTISDKAGIPPERWEHLAYYAGFFLGQLEGMQAPCLDAPVTHEEAP